MSESTPSQRRQKVEPGIYQRTGANGKRVYEIGWRDAAGRQRWKTLKTGGLREARGALAEAQAARARGEQVTANPRLRFNDAADSWWEQRCAPLRPTTRSAYGAALKHVRPVFGNRRLVDISTSDVAAFIAAQQNAGLKAWTIKGHLGAISNVFAHASRRMGYVGGNPVAGLERIERPRTSDEQDRRILTLEETRRLIANVDGGYRLIFEVAAETGGRLSEILGLTWGDVDLDAKTVAFAMQLGRDGQRVPLKTKRSRRCLEITDRLNAHLREAKMVAFDSDKHALVFTTRRGTGHDHRNIGRVMTRAVNRAGLGAVIRDGRIVEPAPTFHSLRHSHATVLIAKDWDLEEISARLGHSDTSTTQRSYIHAYDAARREQSRRDRLASIFHDDSDDDSYGQVVALPRAR